MRRGVSTLVTIVAMTLALAGFGGLAGPARAVAQDDAGFGANQIGDTVDIANAEGGKVAEVTVTDVIDPFEDYAEFSGPGETERFLLALIEIENTGERPFEFSQYDFYVLDSLGRAFSVTFSSRTEESIAEFPDLVSTDMNAGESVSGAVVYRVAADAELVQLYYSFFDDVAHLYLLADLSGLSGQTDAADDADDTGDEGDGTPAAADDADPDETPDASDDDADAETSAADDGDDAADETPVSANGEASAADCEWAEDTLDRLNGLQPVGEELQGMDDADADPERLYEIADDLSAAAADQRDSDPPAFAEDANEQIADALDTYADALEAVADAIDADEEPDTVALLADVAAANELIEDAGAVTGPLLEECGVS